MKFRGSLRYNVLNNAYWNAIIHYETATIIKYSSLENSVCLFNVYFEWHFSLLLPCWKFQYSGYANCFPCSYCWNYFHYKKTLQSSLKLLLLFIISLNDFVCYTNIRLSIIVCFPRSQCFSFTIKEKKLRKFCLKEIKEEKTHLKMNYMRFQCIRLLLETNFKKEKHEIYHQISSKFWVKIIV